MQRTSLAVLLIAAATFLVGIPPAAGQVARSPEAVAPSLEISEDVDSAALALGVSQEIVAVVAGQQSEVEALLARARDLYPTEFAGLWYDADLNLQIAFKAAAADPAGKVNSLFRGVQLTTTPDLRLVTYSLQQLEATKTDLEREWVAALTSPDFHVLDTVGYVDVKESQNTVVLGVADPSAPESLELLRTYGDTVSLRAIAGGSARACTRTNCLGESFRAGLQVETMAGGQTGICTSGFRFIGGVSGRPGFLTAGHCASRGTVVKHAGDFIGNVDYDGVYQQSPADVAYVLWDNGYFGMGVPERWVWRNAVDRRYSISSTGVGGVEGSPMCFTGSVGNTRCGGVVSTDISVREVGTGAVFREQHTMNGCARGGDSGGPVYYSNVGHGIVAGVLINNTTDRVCIDETYFGTIDNIEELYGVDVLP